MLLIRLIQLFNRFVLLCPFSWSSIFSVIEFVFHTPLKCLFHGQVKAPELVVNKVRQQVGALATAASLILLPFFLLVLVIPIAIPVFLPLILIFPPPLLTIFIFLLTPLTFLSFP